MFDRVLKDIQHIKLHGQSRTLHTANKATKMRKILSTLTTTAFQDCNIKGKRYVVSFVVCEQLSVSPTGVTFHAMYLEKLFKMFGCSFFSFLPSSRHQVRCALWYINSTPAKDLLCYGDVILDNGHTYCSFVASRVASSSETLSLDWLTNVDITS